VPQPSSGEIDFLLDVVNTALATRLTHADVIGSYAGLRPLIDNGAAATRPTCPVITRSSNPTAACSASSAAS
jgi:glycerol-3-phosphate dehydrogenase